jgi:hypothetical protein
LKAQEEMHIKITDELLMEQEKKFEEQYREEVKLMKVAYF